MAKRRTTMRKIREVFRLVFDRGLSHRQAAQSCRLSPTTVGAIIKSANSVGLNFAEIMTLSDKVLSDRLLGSDGPDTPEVVPDSCRRIQPDWLSVVEELKKKGVTRRLLWEEYRQRHKDGYSYTRFCERLKMHLNKQNPTLRLEHKFGEKLFVDWAGQTIQYGPNGDKVGYVFVATLGGSNFIFADVYSDMRLGSWLQAHIDMFTSLYDLMDSAYDAPEIYEISKRYGHVPIIDHNKRRGEKKEMSPAQKIRYNERSTAERVNSNLKDNYGGNNVRVRGEAKVTAHLMFGIIALTANQLMKLLI